jgi:hypothetical protein
MYRRRTEARLLWTFGFIIALVVIVFFVVLLGVGMHMK